MVSKEIEGVLIDRVAYLGTPERALSDITG
jgi:hypothetical protein